MMTVIKASDKGNECNDNGDYGDDDDGDGDNDLNQPGCESPLTATLVSQRVADGSNTLLEQQHYHHHPPHHHHHHNLIIDHN